MPLAVILLLFVILKYPHLFYPYYWDESWPYASAVYKMYLHGPSLVPGAIDGELSRGHPLMFHFLAVIWLKAFGISRVAMHSFPLFIAVLFLISIYEAGLRLFNLKTAVTAIILVAFQQIFFVQSSMVLIEMLLAFLGFIGLYFYVTKKYVLTALTLAMLFFTKESGLVLGAVLGIDAFIRVFNKQSTVKEKLLGLLSVAVPVVLIGCFFLAQKAISGWYVLPLYTNTVELKWPAFTEKMWLTTRSVFYDDYRCAFFLLLLLCSAAVAIKKRSIVYAIPFFAGFFVYLFTSVRYHHHFNEHWVVPAYFIAIIATVIAMIGVTCCNSSMQKRFMLLAILFIMSFFIFTGLNIFIKRYLLIALVPLLFIAAVYYNYYINKISRYAFIPSLLLVLLIEGYTFAHTTGLEDNQLGAFDAMYVQEKLINYLEKNKHHGTSISAGSAMERIHITDPYSGFLTTRDTFVNVNWDIVYHTKLVVFDNIEPDNRYEHVKNDSTFQLIFRAARGEAWGEIYSRK